MQQISSKPPFFLTLFYIILGPILGVIIPCVIDSYTGYPTMDLLVIGMVVWMLVWWATEAVPIPITALLPIIAFPFMGILDIKAITANYAHPLIFLFMGGFMLAAAMEKWHLHKRVALTIIYHAGTGSDRIIGGFMLATALLSMWISNTATTVMMLPIALAVIALITSGGLEQNEDTSLAHRPLSKDHQKFAIALLLATAFAANIGGVATLIGTPPNAIFAAYMKESYGVTIDFAKWFAIGFPFATIMLFLTWFVLVRIIFRVKLPKTEETRALIKEELDKLGHITLQEKLVLVIFIMTGLLWILRSVINQFILSQEWGIGTLSDAQIALFATILLFIVPARDERSHFLMDWNTAVHRIPWGILILFGGGLSVATALSHTTIIHVISDYITQNGSLGILGTILCITAVMLLLTELMSNMSLLALLLPIVTSIAISLGQNPLLLAIPVTIASSCAFMMPIATPPNAIVFASGHIRIATMIRTGILLNIIAIILITVLAQTLMLYIFDIDLGTLPAWVPQH